MGGSKIGSSSDLCYRATCAQVQITIYCDPGDKVAAVGGDEQRLAISKGQGASAEGAAVDCPRTGVVIQGQGVTGVVDRADDVNQPTSGVSKGSDPAGGVKGAG